ncbi:MAG: bifunctional phosphopantothenoylcysteine decarboxylase/phosphopantothenate--cysteine ligase CoaBC [Anaerolineaceae bacterium]|nr:bifunctional phosphopantothenoylcysteine decarboxylase/phosphopantothenate--cysteine ligase CoaBC [Anaerolineaceae bacterium]
MSNPIDKKNIILGITGSIAAYKSAEIASRLTKLGALVNIIFTEAGTRFISPLSLQSVSGRKAFTDADLWGSEVHVVHINLAHAANLIVIAPASANTIAKLAHGISDNLLTVTVLAAESPIIIAPAMDSGMYKNEITQKNIKTLKDRGFIFIGPAEGHLASGLKGPGRMVEPVEIEHTIRFLLSRSNPLKNKKIVVTAGGTQEAIDPVRILTNYSTGKQGYALAQAALDAGSNVTLISAPSQLTPPYGCKFIQVKNAESMCTAVLKEIINADALIMAAAVADFRPKTTEKEKIRKGNGFNKIELEPTEDILKKVAELKKSKKLEIKVIGFAAESRDLQNNARSKLNSKSMDMIVANNISDPNAGFGVDTNKVLLMYSDGSTEQLPILSKFEVAEKIILHLQSWLIEGAR